MTEGQLDVRDTEARRALVLHERRLVVDLIELTLNHGLFVVGPPPPSPRRRPFSPSGSRTSPWSTWTTMTAAASCAPRRLPQHRRSVTPVLGLTRRGDLPTKLRAFDLGVDDILTVPFSPEELLARSIVIAPRAAGIQRPIVPTIKARRDGDRIVNRRSARANRSST